jgi:hypothetical protein
MRATRTPGDLSELAPFVDEAELGEEDEEAPEVEEVDGDE